MGGSKLAIPELVLGTVGPTVGRQGLGCMGMSEFYGPTDESAARRTLETALAAGVSLFDTADMYGQGANERFLSPFVAAHRDDVVISTKFGTVRFDDGSMSTSNDPAYVHRAVDASLDRLGIDVIDLYYMHRRDPSVPLAESVGAMAELVKVGKVRFLGLSEVTGSELREAHAIHSISAVQSEWSLFSRDIETSLVPAAAELGVGIVPYSPLGRGLLTGKLPAQLSSDDVRSHFPRFSSENARHNAALLAPVSAIAEARGCTPAQVALAWVQQRSDVHHLPVVPIPGTRRAERLRENLAAAELTLTNAELAQLESIAENVAGSRYPDMSETSVARETH
jgi:aryl-alcohol dehydrogenase-like predicted oxidoreductase